MKQISTNQQTTKFIPMAGFGQEVKMAKNPTYEASIHQKTNKNRIPIWLWTRGEIGQKIKPNFPTEKPNKFQEGVGQES